MPVAAGHRPRAAFGDKGEAMHRQLLDVLCCPFCHGDVRLDYADGSKTAARLRSLGCANASRESLAELWSVLGFDIISETHLLSKRGESNPGDGLPIEESDEWHVMAWVLRKR
jgi:uncharacterized protein YbaR (Trm112 family)